MTVFLPDPHSSPPSGSLASGSQSIELGAGAGSFQKPSSGARAHPDSAAEATGVHSVITHPGFFLDVTPLA